MPLPHSCSRVSLVALALTLSPLASADNHWPAPIEALTAQGLTIHAEFAAPAGLTGYAASYEGGEVAIYLTPDGQHAIVGTLVDAEGTDLSNAALDEHVRAAQEAAAWEQVENGAWIRDGDSQAPRVIYTFSDPNCPFCRELWEVTRPWVEAGDVQIRHVMVGILEQDSPAKAAALLGAVDPAAALEAHYAGREEVEASAQPRDIEEQVYDNNQLFESLGLIATPSTFYRNGERAHKVEGMPSEDRLIDMMGGEAP